LLSNGYKAAAEDKGISWTGRRAEIVYGMPYADWKAQHQTEATPEQRLTNDINIPNINIGTCSAYAGLGHRFDGRGTRQGWP
jgi:hypothetical protein